MSLFWMCVITLGILQVSVLLTTIYLHRGLTHKGLEISPLFGFLAHLHLALFTGIYPRQWVAVHRKHHHYSDKEGDPHSPVLLGMWRVLFGNAFLYQKEAKNMTTVRKYTPDYHEDPIDKLPGIIHSSLGGLVIFMLLFGWKWGLAAYAFHAVAYVLLNSSINSICHIVGYRNYDNQATNVQVIALMTGGEGLHNNHHAYPTSARFSLRRGEIDPAWPVICVLEWFGLVKVNRVPIAKAA